MIVFRFLPFLTGIAILTAAVPAARAWDGIDQRYRHAKPDKVQWRKDDRRDRSGISFRPSNRSLTRDGRLRTPDKFETSNYYSSASGIYFVGNGYPGLDYVADIALAPKAKIIDVEAEMGGNAFASEKSCSFEAGVCVIRGGN